MCVEVPGHAAPTLVRAAGEATVVTITHDGEMVLLGSQQELLNKQGLSLGCFHSVTRIGVDVNEELFAVASMNTTVCLSDAA